VGDEWPNHPPITQKPPTRAGICCHCAAFVSQQRGGLAVQQDGKVRGLPGDGLVAASAMRSTRGLTIDASPEAVWQWLVQIAEDRGGFYSYGWLQRLVGARVHNTPTVRPEWQQLHVGSIIWLARRYGRSAQLVVAAVESGSHLVMVFAVCVPLRA